MCRVTGEIWLHDTVRPTESSVLYVKGCFIYGTAQAACWTDATVGPLFITRVSRCVHGPTHSRRQTRSLSGSYWVWTGGTPGWRPVSSRWAGTGSGSRCTRRFWRGARTPAAACPASPSARSRSATSFSRLRRQQQRGHGYLCPGMFSPKTSGCNSAETKVRPTRVADLCSGGFFLTDSGFLPDVGGARWCVQALSDSNHRVIIVSWDFFCTFSKL